MAKKISPEETEAFVWQLKLLIAGFVILFLVPLFIYAYFLDRRLGSFEDSLRYRPPQETANEVGAAGGDLHHLSANPVSGQLVYVPAYSHVYHGGGDPFLLSITLSIRNTSRTEGIIINSVRYFDTQGREVHSYFKKPVRVAALGATEILVGQDDAAGGSGASFLVEWFAHQPVTEPIIEAVMIGTKSQQGISFARRGSVISELVPPPSTDTTGGGDATEDQPPTSN